MKKDELLTVFGTHDIRTLPECIMSLLFGDQEVRDDVFRELIRCHAGDLSYDWFQEVYEEELSERRKKGQDFTGRSLCLKRNLPVRAKVLSTNLLRGQEGSLFSIGGSWHRSNCLGVSNRTPVYSHAGNSQIDRFQFYC